MNSLFIINFSTTFRNDTSSEESEEEEENTSLFHSREQKGELNFDNTARSTSSTGLKNVLVEK